MRCRYGFRIVGGIWERRRPVDAAAALTGYCSCDGRAEVEREGYLSAFQFGDDFRQLLESSDSVSGFDGVCWSPWHWFDIDAAGDLDRAAMNARRLCKSLIERYRLTYDMLLVFFSGSKGFHVGLPTALWSPEPSPSFHKTARQFAERIAEAAGVMIDRGVYNAVQPFRARILGIGKPGCTSAGCHLTN